MLGCARLPGNTFGLESDLLPPPKTICSSWIFILSLVFKHMQSHGDAWISFASRVYSNIQLGTLRKSSLRMKQSFTGQKDRNTIIKTHIG